MNVQELIDELKSQNIVLYSHGYRLLWKPTIDGIEPSDEIKEAVKEHWDEIIKRVDGDIPYSVPRGIRGTIKFHQNDCMNIMDLLPANLVDLIVTDPPYGLSFMGKDWDKAVPSVEIWKECLRILKPGGFAFIMCIPRQDLLARMIVNLQDAGFDTGFTSLYWTFASGMLKAHNIKKALNKKGVSESKDLEGSYAGFQPKPAVEVVLIVQKPIEEKTYTDQALANRKGITWLDDCRIPYPDEKLPSAGDRTCNFGEQETVPGGKYGLGWKANQDGRTPANLVVSDNILDGACTHQGGFSKFFSLDAWGGRNMDGLHINALEEFDQNVVPFLIVPKPSKKEKDFGCEGLELKPSAASDFRPNHKEKAMKGDTGNPYGRWKKLKNNHPTVKPFLLMSYLITLGSRPGDLILDPFCGTGTTCMAAKLLRRPSIGIEKNPDYVDIATARIRALTLATWGEDSESENDTAAS